MKNVVNERDIKIENNKIKLKELQAELEEKILSFEDEEQSYSSESDEDNDSYLNYLEKKDMIIGRVHF